jgi:hypothetical protein
MNTAKINSELKIIKLGTQKFKAEGGYYKPNGYAICHPELGYFSFEEDYPYIPVGGRKTLKSILDAGGFTDFNSSYWIQPIN